MLDTNLISDIKLLAPNSPLFLAQQDLSCAYLSLHSKVLRLFLFSQGKDGRDHATGLDNQQV